MEMIVQHPDGTKEIKIVDDELWAVPEPETTTSDLQYALEILLGGHDDELDDIISSNGA